MNNFSTYLSEAKNTHMMHIENALLYQGVKGTEQAIKALEDIFDALKGHTTGDKIITQKYDGAPAVFAGPDPQTGEFFVAKKSIFNTEPKVYKSENEIKADTTGDLADKLIAAYKYLKPLNLDKIYQGDIMFTQNDLKAETIDGEKYITFHPNTIVYAVPADSDFGKKLKTYKLGIVFHTVYTGKTFQSLTAGFNIDVDQYKNNANVWIEDAYVKDVAGKVSLSAGDSKDVNDAIVTAKKLYSKLNRGILKQIEDDQDLARDIETFQNSFIRSGIEVTNTAKHVQDLINWFDSRFEKEKEARKSEKGKESISVKQKERMAFFSKENQVNLKALFDLQRAMIVAKTLLFNQLDRVGQLDTFLKTTDGFKVTGTEGFVISDKIGNAYKLVDRMEFAKSNFSKDIIKGWQRDS